jgi:mannose-6-phosphate isomerase-like protein (cupin superfamily)
MRRLEAQLEVGGETIDVRSGDVRSVDGGQDHHFLNITGIWPSWPLSFRPTTHNPGAGVGKVIETPDAPRDG